MPKISPNAWLWIMFVACAVSWIAVYHVVKDGSGNHKALALLFLII